MKKNQRIIRILRTYRSSVISDIFRRSIKFFTFVRHTVAAKVWPAVVQRDVHLQTASPGSSRPTRAENKMEKIHQFGIKTIETVKAAVEIPQGIIFGRRVGVLC